jgi:ornithine decarboxylase
VAKQLIPGPYTIDIGGGFVNSGFEEAATQIRRVRGYIPSNTRVIAEPGRFFASTCQDLFVKVIGKKATHDRRGFRYTLDESLYGQFSCIPFDQATPKWIRVSDGTSRKKCSAVLYGRTCDSVDMIAKAEQAEELMEGDWLWFPNMGAYTTVTSTEFNGFPRPPLISVEKDSLPCLNEFESHEWPSQLSYVRHVSVAN